MSRSQKAAISPAIHRMNSTVLFQLLRVFLLLNLVPAFQASLSAALPTARDATFQTLPMDGIANASVLLPDGRILIGGTFQNIGGVSRPALARLNANGSLDTSFAPPIGGSGLFGKGTLTDLAVLADGKIMAAGSAAFRTTGAVLRTNIIRFNPDGSVDASFDARDISFWRGLAVHGDGRAVISMSTATAPYRPVRLTASGAIDPTFNYPNAFQSGAIPLQFNAQADGKTLVVFGDSDPNRNGIQQLSRLNADGTLDGTFKFAASLQSLTDDSPVAVGADGRILVTFSDALSGGGPVVTRLAADGTRDTSFAWTGSPNAQRLYPVGAIFLPDGGVVAVRQPTAGDRRLSFFYLTAGGNLVATRDLPNSAFDNGVVGLGTIAARAFAMQPDGRLLFAAGFLDGGQNIFGMFRMPPPPAPAPPLITVQPLSQTVGAGDFLSLSVTATSDSAMSYRWYHNSTNLFPAQTNAFLGLSNTSDERAGEFFVVVSNAFGSVTSAVATITVRVPAPMVITRQPQGGAVRLSQSYNLLVQFQTEVNAGYQWFKNGVALPNGGGMGFGSASLNLPANDNTRAGDYHVVITNSFGGSVTSAVAHIDLILPGPPQFTVQPQDISIFASQPVLLSAMALGDGVPAYRWMHEGTNLVAGADIPSVTGTNLSISARRTNRFGSYALVATLTPGGTTTSRVATVTLLPSGPPILLSQPGDLGIGIGDRTNLQAGFNAEAPVTIFWQRAGTNLLTQTFNVLDGAATNILTVLGVPSAAGEYLFIATNRFGAVTSRIATVSVQSPAGAEIRRDLVDVTATLGEYNTTTLSNGLVVTNCCGNIETTHILALTPTSGIPPFPTEGTWHLGVGASNRFYVGARSGFPTVTGTWSFVPGATSFTGIWLTNFPASGNLSRLETFDDGRYSLALTGGTASQSGTFRVLGTRRPSTNILSFDLVGSNSVSVTWYKDGVPVGGQSRGGRNLIATTESIGVAPAPGGVNTRYKLTIGDVVPADAGKYWAVIENFVRNPDTSFGQPAFLLTSTSTSRVATVSMRGYAAGEAPEIVSAATFGGPSSTDEVTALAALPGNQVLLATKSIFFGANASQQATISIRSASGETLWTADQRAETLNGGPIGTVKALAPDGEGGAFIAGDGASGTLDPWFLRRIRPAMLVSNGVTNRTFTNLWTARVAGPFTNGLDDLTVPRGADVVGVVRVGDGVLVAGHFTGKTRFGSTGVVTNALFPQFTAKVGGVTLTNAFDATFGRNDGSKDLYLVKFDPLGQMHWVRQYGGTNAETITSLTVDPAGNIYLAGSFKTRTTFGSTTVESTRSLPANGIPFYAADGFVSKLDPTGHPLWIRTIGGIRESSISDTVVAAAVADGRGEVTFFANRVAGQAFIHPGLMASPHFLGRLNAAGELLWTQEFTSQGNAQLALDPDSNILFVDSVFGSNLTNSASFGAGLLAVPPWAGSVAASFSPSGSLLWFRALDEKLQFVDDARTVTPQKIAVDPEGGLVIAGRFPGGSPGLGRSSGQRLDRFEFPSESSAGANPTDVVFFKLASSFAPSAPTMIRNPASQTALLQDRVVLEGLAEGYPIPQYQWLVDGKPIAGATGRVLIIPDLARTNRGTYTLVASNSVGVATSTPIQLTPQPRPNMTGWTLVTSATNYLGNALRVSADDAGNFQLLHNELSRGASAFLEGFRPDGSWAWRFQETVTGIPPVLNLVYTIQPRVAPVTLGSGEIIIAGKAQLNRLQGAGSTRNFLGRLNPADGTPLWMINELGAVGSNISALDVQDSVIRVLLTDRTFHRIGLDGKVLTSGTVSHVPFTTAEANSRTSLDRDGGYYFYGNRIEALNLGTTNLPALGTSGAQTFILAKYNPSGLLQWFQSHSGQGVGAVEPFTLLVAPDGDAILVSRPAAGSGANNRFQIGTNLLSGYSIAARFSPAGAVRWAKAWWLNADDAALGPDGNLVIGGWFRTDPTAAPGNKQISFGTNRVAAASIYDIFVASVDASGNERYIRQSGSPAFVTFGNARDAAVAVNRSGSVWVGGFSQMPPSSAALDFGDLRYAWPDLKAYNIGNLFGDLSTFFVARLDAETIAPTVAEITFAPPAPGGSTLRLGWPAGFRLQHRETLYSGDWTTLDVVPPYDADIKAATQGYFRVIRAGQ